MTNRLLGRKQMVSLSLSLSRFCLVLFGGMAKGWAKMRKEKIYIYI